MNAGGKRMTRKGWHATLISILWDQTYPAKLARQVDLSRAGDDSLVSHQKKHSHNVLAVSKLFCGGDFTNALKATDPSLIATVVVLTRDLLSSHEIGNKRCCWTTASNNECKRLAARR